MLCAVWFAVNGSSNLQRDLFSPRQTKYFEKGIFVAWFESIEKLNTSKTLALFSIILFSRYCDIRKSPIFSRSMGYLDNLISLLFLSIWTLIM